MLVPVYWGSKASHSSQSQQPQTQPQPQMQPQMPPQMQSQMPPQMQPQQQLQQPSMVIPPKWAPGTLAHAGRVSSQNSNYASSPVPQYHSHGYFPSPIPMQHQQMMHQAAAAYESGYQTPVPGYSPMHPGHGQFEDPRIAGWQNRSGAGTPVFGGGGASSVYGYDSAWESSSQRPPSPTGSDTGSLSDPNRKWTKWGRSKHQFASMPGELHGVSSQKQSYRRVQTMLGMVPGPSNQFGTASPVPSLPHERPNSASGYKPASPSPVPMYQSNGSLNIAGRVHSRAESYSEGMGGGMVPSAQLAPPAVDVPQPKVPAYNSIPAPGTVQSVVAAPPARNHSLRRKAVGAPLPNVGLQQQGQPTGVPTITAPPARISSRHATFKVAMQQLQQASDDGGSPLPPPTRGFFGAFGDGSETEDDGFGVPRRRDGSSSSSDKDETSVRGVQVVLVKDIEAVVERTMAISYDEADRALAWAKATADEEEKFEVLEFLLDHLVLLPPPPPDYPDRAVNLGLEVVAIMRKLAYKKYNPRAQYTMGNLYVSGLPDNCRKRDKTGNPEVWKPQYARANELWLMAGKRNHADAIYNSALCAERGLGATRSGQRALQLYRKAGALNHPGAMTRLAQALLRGELGATKNPRDAIKWLTLAVSYANDRFPNACVELARCYSEGLKNGVVIRDESYAFGLLLKGSDLGDPEAHFRLGRCFETGHLSNTVRQDLAVHHYALAAAMGHAEAALEMSGLYLAGYPSEHAEDKVETVLTKRRPNEDSDDSDSDDEVAPVVPRTTSLGAQMAGSRGGLAMTDMNGEVRLPPKPQTFTLPQSDTLALQYAVLAAEQGLPRGMFALGYFYDNGIGVKEDVEAAVAWYKEAAQRGDTEAWNRLREMGRGDWKWSVFADKKEREARKMQKKMAKQAKRTGALTPVN
ncbi:hypothetical protein M427DRAFT_134594 [Gonapodya prolifera JEL478]|uniref:HCP-like protein n=1 Tax=Gonapodya prolifera (strain JEL478) TaxID=1344416 RepID=A0A139AH67_GONPJ|nr:hypothetical protein M427DRAFT_134594 [Gonapodya prolifera JEL478]|eukprot:KXS16162.1 hypothetical protein M427DRAFT_134594 [Gonapodya prolifera JEL478]